MSENTMVRYERYLYKPEILTAILDLCDIVHVGFQDVNNAYILPMCFAYEATEESLNIFIHTSKEGYKMKLIERNPRVCCSFAEWRSFPDRPYRNHIHDFRSVVAFGEMHLIDPVTEAEYVERGMKALLAKSNRTECHNPKGMGSVNMYVVTCKWENVTGKSEIPVRTPEDVPFVDFYNVESNDEPYYDEDLYRSQPEKIQSTEYLGLA